MGCIWVHITASLLFTIRGTSCGWLPYYPPPLVYVASLPAPVSTWEMTGLWPHFYTMWEYKKFRCLIVYGNLLHRSIFINVFIILCHTREMLLQGKKGHFTVYYCICVGTLRRPPYFTQYFVLAWTPSQHHGVKQANRGIQSILLCHVVGLCWNSQITQPPPPYIWYDWAQNVSLFIFSRKLGCMHVISQIVSIPINCFHTRINVFHSLMLDNYFVQTHVIFAKTYFVLISYIVLSSLWLYTSQAAIFH